MKIVINPQYKCLTPFIKSLPDSFNEHGNIVYDERNTLKRFSVEGYDIIVKRFRIPIFINRFVYTYLRPSKAMRSYNNSFILLEKGILAPDPIAYIEEKKNGLFRYSYYISIFDSVSSHIRKQMSDKDDIDFQKALACFIAKLHEKGILFLDLSPGNILFHTVENKLVFSLVDVNRMRFMFEIPKKDRYKNFERLSVNKTIVTNLAKEYAKACSFDEQEVIIEITKACKAFFGKKKRKKLIKPQQ